MDRGERWAQMLTILKTLKAHGSWCGETHVQKSAYFLKDGLGLDLPYSFILYNYGPFSFDIEQLLGELRGVSLIDIFPREPYGPSLVVSPSGRHLMAKSSALDHRFEEQVAFVAEGIGKRNVAELERICTALYMQRHYQNELDEQHARRINRLKPHISEGSALNALQEVRKVLASADERGLINSTDKAVV